MPRFRLNQSAAVDTQTAISGPDAKHLRNVLRIKPGDTLRLFDDDGHDYLARVVDISPDRIDVTIKEKFPSETESPLKIVLAQAMLKDRKIDEVIRHITELGVAAFIPFLAHRSVSRPDSKKIPARMERWKKIAAEALKQCGRSRAPDIRPVESFEEMLIQAKNCDAKLIFWEGKSVSQESDPACNQVKIIHSAAVVIGPEGGFTDQEIEQAQTVGFAAASLGPRILKADTAAIAACTLVQHRFGDMAQNYS